ncbi:hypothetical protein BD410DRAFT_840842 [Rickenella mellea]|uniref:Uncharacterized protein n=1 Tax=Rickenella mellea TaxID=50990 RepID=A0A4Y7Q161_9AGAM|nr:hypothetical protein BD410DRAFT_840842 [Rickenella mellea]
MSRYGWEHSPPSFLNSRSRGAHAFTVQLPRTRSSNPRRSLFAGTEDLVSRGTAIHQVIASRAFTIGLERGSQQHQFEYELGGGWAGVDGEGDGSGGSSGSIAAGPAAADSYRYRTHAHGRTLGIDMHQNLALACRRYLTPPLSPGTPMSTHDSSPASSETM